MYVKEVSILGIVLLEVVALMQGINGILLTTVIAVIAGIAGYEFRIYRNRGDKDELYNLPEELQE